MTNESDPSSIEQTEHIRLLIEVIIKAQASSFETQVLLLHRYQELKRMVFVLIGIFFLEIALVGFSTGYILSYVKESLQRLQPYI